MKQVRFRVLTNTSFYEMPKNTGFILHTPLQSWSCAGKKCTYSMLASDIEHAMTKRSTYIIIENVVGLQKSATLKLALDSLKETGYTVNVLDISNKTLIVGKK